MTKKATEQEVLQAARELEAKPERRIWTAVSIYLHLYPDEKSYRTKETGVTAIVQRLANQGRITKHTAFGRGRYHLTR